ncbi:MAG: hypothetical protein LAO76_26345 [Acidobacteriia bacterium]|nr:hypothetical protein [Terriglobia bacterium]
MLECSNARKSVGVGNALATSIADYLQLRRAERAVDALEAMKEDPEFQRMAFKSDRGNRGPDGWKPTTLLQFQGWLFEPHTAEVLQRYSNIMYGDPYTWLDFGCNRAGGQDDDNHVYR